MTETENETLIRDALRAPASSAVRVTVFLAIRLPPHILKRDLDALDAVESKFTTGPSPCGVQIKRAMALLEAK